VCKKEKGMYIYLYRNEGAYGPPECAGVCVCVLMWKCE